MYPLDHSFDPVSKEDVVDLNDQNQMLLYCYCLTESGYHALEEFDVAVSFIKGKIKGFFTVRWVGFKWNWKNSQRDIHGVKEHASGVQNWPELGPFS